MLYEDLIEVEERVILHQDKCELGLSDDVVIGKTMEKVGICNKICSGLLQDHCYVK